MKTFGDIFLEYVCLTRSGPHLGLLIFYLLVSSSDVGILQLRHRYEIHPSDYIYIPQITSYTLNSFGFSSLGVPYHTRYFTSSKKDVHFSLQSFEYFILATFPKHDNNLIGCSLMAGVLFVGLDSIMISAIFWL